MLKRLELERMSQPQPVAFKGFTLSASPSLVEPHTSDSIVDEFTLRPLSAMSRLSDCGSSFRRCSESFAVQPQLPPRIEPTRYLNRRTAAASPADAPTMAISKPRRPVSARPVEVRKAYHPGRNAPMPTTPEARLRLAWQKVRAERTARDDMEQVRRHEAALVRQTFKTFAAEARTRLDQPLFAPKAIRRYYTRFPTCGPSARAYEQIIAEPRRRKIAAATAAAAKFGSALRPRRR